MTVDSITVAGAIRRNPVLCHVCEPNVRHARYLLQFRFDFAFSGTTRAVKGPWRDCFSNWSQKMFFCLTESFKFNTCTWVHSITIAPEFPESKSQIQFRFHLKFVLLVSSNEARFLRKWSNLKQPCSSTVARIQWESIVRCCPFPASFLKLTDPSVMAGSNTFMT